MSVSINTPSGRTMASAATVVSSTTASQNPAQAPAPPHWIAHQPDTGPRNRAIAKPRRVEGDQAPDRPRGCIRQSQAATARMASPRHPAAVHRGVHRTHLHRAGRLGQSGLRSVRCLGHAAVRQQRAAARRAVAQREGDSRTVRHRLFEHLPHHRRH